jgi:hypothetical protein
LANRSIFQNMSRAIAEGGRRVNVVSGIRRVAGGALLATALLGRPSPVEAASPSPRPVATETTTAGSSSGGLTPENVIILTAIIALGAFFKAREVAQLVNTMDRLDPNNTNSRNS